MNDILMLIFQFVVFIFSVMVHEVAHGIMAYRLGDDTAKQMNRLNLNPLNHIDPFGSVFLPLFLFMMRSPFLFGWAKPVPYNPYNLRNPKSGSALIGIAGPLSNFSIAVIFGILIRIIGSLNFPANFLVPLDLMFSTIIFVNLLLGVFNLVPIPPLDGSKILFALLPRSFYRLENFMEKYGMWLLIFFIIFGIGILDPLIRILYAIIVG